jgi:hypothetical protein
VVVGVEETTESQTQTEEEVSLTRKRRCPTPTQPEQELLHKRSRGSPDFTVCFHEEEIKTNTSISPDITDTAPEQFNFPLISLPVTEPPAMETTSEDWFLPNSPPCCDFETDYLPDLTNDFIDNGCGRKEGPQSPVSDINLLENNDSCSSEELWSLINTEEL